MDYDIVIIGAGLSGIGAACHLERKNPEKKYKISKYEYLEYSKEILLVW